MVPRAVLDFMIKPPVRYESFKMIPDPISKTTRTIYRYIYIITGYLIHEVIRVSAIFMKTIRLQKVKKVAVRSV